jgi:hypothetical protein
VYTGGAGVSFRHRKDAFPYEARICTCSVRRLKTHAVDGEGSYSYGTVDIRLGVLMVLWSSLLL